MIDFECFRYIPLCKVFDRWWVLRVVKVWIKVLLEVLFPLVVVTPGRDALLIEGRDTAFLRTLELVFLGAGLRTKEKVIVLRHSVIN